MFGIDAICSCQQVYAETTKQNFITLHAKRWSVCKVQMFVQVWWDRDRCCVIHLCSLQRTCCPSVLLDLSCGVEFTESTLLARQCWFHIFLFIFLCSLKHTMCFICSFISFKALFLWAYSSVKVFIVSIVSDVVHCITSCAFQKAVLWVFSILCLRVPGV